MKRLIKTVLLLCALTFPSTYAEAQIDIGRMLSGGVKAVQALTLTDQQLANYVRESVQQMDRENPVAPEGSDYDNRLRRLTANITQADGLPLNFKVYLVKDVNAFACPDGSVRVFSSLMDIMDDDELLGVIGHEIGHVAKHHSKKAYKHALLGAAAQDALASASSLVAVLSDSQLGALSQSLINANYSRKQENEADQYGYDFLKMHGINPLAMAKAFKKFEILEQNSSQSNAYLQKMFSSHPDTKKRIKNIEKRAKKDGYTYDSPSAIMTTNTVTTPEPGNGSVKKQDSSKDTNSESATEKWLKSHGH